MKEELEIYVGNDKRSASDASNLIPEDYPKKIARELGVDVVALFVLRNNSVSSAVVGEDKSGDGGGGIFLLRVISDAVDEMRNTIRKSLVKAGISPSEYGL